VDRLLPGGRTDTAHAAGSLAPTCTHSSSASSLPCF
jgi:hypothetical protein